MILFTLLAPLFEINTDSCESARDELSRLKPFLSYYFVFQNSSYVINGVAQYGNGSVEAYTLEISALNGSIQEGSVQNNRGLPKTKDNTMTGAAST